MDGKEFVRCGKWLVDYCADYMDTLRQRECLPKIKPGYLAEIQPKDAPEQPEKWEDIVKDFEPCIMEGMSHWQHPHFHAYFPAGNTWPSVMGDAFSNACGVQVSTWDMCPAATELEVIVMDWCAKFLDLPIFFQSKISNPNSQGGGVMQCSASESILLSMLCARERGVRKLQLLYPDKPRAVLLSMMRGYASACSHSSVDKGGMIANVSIQFMEPSERGAVLAMTLTAAIEEDKKKGFFPFFYSSILGSTSTCAFDDIEEIGPVAVAYDIWLHVDGAYAGSSFCCPELRHLKTGLEYAWSFNTNTNKWMLTNFDCSLHWLRYRSEITDFFSGYDQSIHNKLIPDYHHWGIPFGRRFRAFKLWMVIRTYGVEGLQKYIRSHVYLAKLFEKYVHRDPRFETVGEVKVGLCCFVLKGPNELTEELLEALNTSRKIHMVPAKFQGKYVIRFALCAEITLESDIDYAWNVISEYAFIIIQNYKSKNTNLDPIQELLVAQKQYEATQETREKSKQLQEIRELAEKSVKEAEAADDYLIRSTSQLDDLFDEDEDADDTWKKDSKFHQQGGKPYVKPTPKKPLQSMCVIS